MGTLLCKDCSHAPESVPQNKSAGSNFEQPQSLGNNTADDAAKFLLGVKLFQRLPEGQLPILAGACEPVEYKTGQTVIREGDQGNEFFIIKSGEALVSIAENQVATLKDGDYFGENALLRDEPRTATIKAKTDLSTFKVTRVKFEELGLREKLDFPQRKAVGGGAVKELQVKPPSPKTPEERKLMVEALKNNTNLQSCVPLDGPKMDLLIDAAWKEDIAAGNEIIKEGDLNADYFYIVQSGKFTISVQAGATQSADAAQAAASNSIGAAGPGKSFGELALLYFAPRAATVKAEVASVVWVIDRKNFKDILAKSTDDISKEYIKYLDKVEILSPLKPDEKAAIAKALTELQLTKDETIFQQGESGDVFYILIEGNVSVIKDGNEQVKLTATAEKGHMFGERALLNNEPRNATVKVVSETAKALTLDRQSFDMLLGPLEELKNRSKDAPSKLVEKPKPAAPPATAGGGKRFGNIERKHLKQLGLLGCGGFGAVELVEHTETKDTYALKALSKGYVVKSGMQQSVISEKNVQLMCDSIFIIKLYETFNGTQTLYFLLELAQGGELYATYNKKGLFGKEAHAKFYTAGVVLAFDHMHAKKIIFRDLKPENLLLNELGQIKLTDMGLAKVVVGKTYTTCGTPDYFAPELIASAGHTYAVDWWTLGVLLFELLGGHPPFESAYPMQIYQKVTKGINKVSFPPKCKGLPEDLIKNLCKKEPAERLAMKKGGSGNIKKHNFFKGFDWDAFERLKMDPPHKPAVKSKKDIANFSVRKEDMPPHVPYKDDGTGWDRDFATST
eukprot:TRINITY_DN7758_c0_g3_i1.p1 TRINITY_DN7758_c0_g3~~TRINITY_DN7758_c0_g3_i1.p1  ORF type:complete len:802 (+),score=204.51 TRINITY_DN7758_c0_g3_i1:31-2406(+)